MDFVGLVDENYNRYGLKQIGNKLRVSAMPYLYDIAEGNVTGHEAVHRYGYNGATAGGSYETLWSGSSLMPYLTSGEKLQISGGANDAGTLLASGTGTIGSTTTILEDTTADFVAAGVAQGDIVLLTPPVNYCAGFRRYGIVKAITTTQLTVCRTFDTAPYGLDYRVVTPASTGASVVKLSGLNFDFEPICEHVILNGATDVETTKEFYRVHTIIKIRCYTIA
ncbi:hypothetical protein TI05_15445 [Achromatium sp. WMS3]|nr:hypothetical protein TI05_15445 [Achromatium sp. WMS3]